jgi:hypothetical protein
MKRYTGQKALYEAISRSQAKAKRGNILDKLRLQPAPQGEQIGVEPEAAAESSETPAAAPLVDEPAVPTVKEPPESPTVEKPAVEEKPRLVVEKAELQELIERPEPPVVRSRPVERLGRPTPASPVKPWLRPKAVQLNGGRVEISMSYHVGVAVTLAAIVVVLAAFRLGQKYNGVQAPPAARANPPARSAEDTVPAQAGLPQMPMPVAPPRAADPVPPQASQQGDHWIVLAQYQKREDLVPVVEYFGQQGIELGIVSLDRARQFFAENKLNVGVLPSGSGYLLVTKNAYNNPAKEGTDGYKMKQKIIEAGKGYKAPPGNESFAPNYFGDAYPMKIR